MSNWVESTRITYRRWRDPETSEGSFQGGEHAGAPDSGGPSPRHEPEVDSGDRDHGSQAESNHSQDVLTVQDCVDTLGFGGFQLKLSVLTGLSSLADAMETMLLSILGPQLLCEWRLSAFQVALLTAAVFLGMAVSSPLWGNVCDKYGRKTGLMMSVVWTFYYGLLSAFAPTLGWILVLRGLVGVGIGGAPQAYTLYFEFLPRKSRALFIVLSEALYSVGAVVAVVLAMLIMPSLGWRWLLGAAALPLLLYIGSYSWLPESAHFDLQVGNRDRAMATLKHIAAENGKAAPAGRLTAGYQRERGRLRDLLSPAYLRTTLLLWAIWFALAFSYSGIVLLTTALLQEGDECQATHRARTDPDCSLECRYLTQDDYKGLLLTTLAEFPGMFVTLLVVDRIGRKKSMALCLVLFSASTLPLFGCIGRTALTIFIFFARASISGGLQVVYVYTPEVFPTETRALGLGTCSTMARLAAFLAPFVSQVLTSASLPMALALYCSCSLLAAAAAMSLPVETGAGQGLQESHREAAGPSPEPQHT